MGRLRITNISATELVKKQKRSPNFTLPPLSANLNDDTTVNSSRVVGVPPEVESCYRCQVCHQFAAEDVYLCEDGEHSVCNGCYKHLRSDRFHTKLGSICLTSWTRVPPKFFKLAKFPCANFVCGALIGGGDEWIQHLKICKSKFVACPDDSCKEQRMLIPNDKFVKHCVVVHNLKFLKKKRFWFHVKCSKDISNSIVAICKIQDQLAYVVAQTSSQTVVISCFLVDHTPEVATLFEVKITPLSNNGENCQLTKTWIGATVNLPGRNLFEATLFRRSASFSQTQLQGLDGRGENVDNSSESNWKFELELKDGELEKKEAEEQASRSVTARDLTGGWKPFSEVNPAKMIALLARFIQADDANIDLSPETKEMLIQLAKCPRLLEEFKQSDGAKEGGNVAESPEAKEMLLQLAKCHRLLEKAPQSHDANEAGDVAEKPGAQQLPLQLAKNPPPSAKVEQPDDAKEAGNVAESPETQSVPLQLDKSPPLPPDANIGNSRRRRTSLLEGTTRLEPCLEEEECNSCAI